MSHIKKEKCFVKLDKAIPRDEVMYNFDKETVRKIMLNINRQEFNFSTYLPCGIKKDINDSRVSLASTAASAQIIKNIHRSHSRVAEDLITQNSCGPHNRGLSSRKSSASFFGSVQNHKNANMPAIDINMNEMQQIEGSFLLEHKGSKKLIDISQYNKNLKRTREYVVGERNNHTTLAIKDKPNFL